MNVRLLGPVEATFDGRPLPLGATKQRAVLAMLALRPNATVSLERLVDGLWGAEPPATASKMVQLYVSQLRRLLDGTDAAIVTHGRGYELRLPDHAVDAAVFERLVENAHGDGAANGAARKALAMWRGDALTDVASEPFAAAEVRRLQGLRQRAAELAVESELAAGRNQNALAELDRLIEAAPLRESLYALRMLALYRSGRQVEALEAFRAARQRLVEEAGVEPCVELRELHERMLRQDPDLTASVPNPAWEPVPAPPRGETGVARAPVGRGRMPSPWRLAVAAAVAVMLTGAVFAVLRATGPDRLPGIDEGAIGVIDSAAAAVIMQYRIGAEPGSVAAGGGSIWVASPNAGTVSRIRPGSDRITTIDVGPAPSALAFGARSLWVAGGEDGTVAQVDPATNRVVQRIRVGIGLRALAVGGGAVWAAAAVDGHVARIDLRSGRVTARTAVGGHPAALAVSEDAVWAAAEQSGTVARLDSRSGEILGATPVGNGPSAVAVGLGAVWVANRVDGTVSRIDPATDRVTDTFPAGRAPIGLAIADGALWVADEIGAVLRVDPHTHAIAATFRTGSPPAGLAVADAAVWVTARASPAVHRGGTLRVGWRDELVLEPSLYAPVAPVVQLAYDGLVAYRRAAGAAGARLVGALAVEVPRPLDSGTRYVFRLRRGVRYSDGTPFRARDVRASIERALALGPTLAPQFGALAGATICGRIAGRCDLASAIAADERAGTVTIRLRRPDPQFLERLAQSSLSIVPAATPRRQLSDRPPPGTGPYRIARIVPGRAIHFERNPYFGARGPDGRPDGFPDRIELTLGRDERARITAVERGELDLTEIFESGTAQQIAALRARGTRLFSGIYAATEYAWFNVRARPFNDPRVRLALNLAVDRERVVELTGGPDNGSTTCQLLPPGLAGHRPTCPFTAGRSPAGGWTAPDVARAERLVAASGTRGTAVEVWAYKSRFSVGRHLVDVLRSLGFRAHLRKFDHIYPAYQAAIDPRQRPQIGLTDWIAEGASPTTFIRPLVACDGYVPRDETTTNLTRFCDPGLDAAIDQVHAAEPVVGNRLQRIERRIARAAPVVPLRNDRWLAVASARVGNVQFHPLTGVLLDQIWVR